MIPIEAASQNKILHDRCSVCASRTRQRRLKEVLIVKTKRWWDRHCIRMMCIVRYCRRNAQASTETTVLLIGDGSFVVSAACGPLPLKRLTSTSYTRSEQAIKSIQRARIAIFISQMECVKEGVRYAYRVLHDTSGCEDCLSLAPGWKSVKRTRVSP